ncbi:MAG TPA: tyrosine-protein phosphatase [Pyrinomonadaceae bacterium]|nr:tyrosine-protein phosphatase [Pyrinomonadaceae bacterium]
MCSLHQAARTAAVLLLFLSATAFAQDATGYADLPRFQHVSERLYRGAQPRRGGFSRLRELGIDTIINLRGPNKQTRAEEAEARALGLNYFNIELPRWGRPQDARVARILEIIAAPENGEVLIHCRDGVDRTGMIVAIYRMTHDKWNSHDALAEAERYGMRRIQFWMRDYAEDYGERVVKLGPETALQSPGVDEDFGDRIGAGMRIVEKGALRARKYAGRFVRKFSGSLP